MLKNLILLFVTRTLYLNSIELKISFDGLKCISVPVSSHWSISVNGLTHKPSSNSRIYFFPPLLICNFSHFDSAFTTETPRHVNPLRPYKNLDQIFHPHVIQSLQSQRLNGFHHPLNEYLQVFLSIIRDNY